MSDVTWWSDGYQMAEKSAKNIETFFKRHKKGGKVLTLTLMGQQCTINFDKMQMTKEGGKKKYSLKRKEGDESSSEAESETESTSTEEDTHWEYKDPKKGWQPLKTGFQLALEKAYTSAKGSKSFDKKIGKQTLHFDLKAMTQKDKTTNVKCKIRRMDGDDDDESSSSSSDPKKKKPSKKQSKRAVTSDSESESDEAPSPSKSKTKNKPKPKAKSKVKSKRDNDSDSEEESRRKSAKKSSAGGTKKKLIKKGRGAVEPLSGKQDDCHIHECGPDVYQCMLNQSNLHSNNNKFYQIQLIESDKNNQWWVFTRWGRIGVPGSTGIESHSSAASAVQAFKKKFKDKTKNDWDKRANFQKYKDKYQLMDIKLGDDDSSDDDGTPDKDAVECTLEPALRSVIELISDKKAMLKTLKQFEINTDELPLGMISKDQIKRAFKHLKTIDQELRKPRPSNTILQDASSGFYTLIPHVVGMRQLTAIKSDEMVQEKMKMLDALADIEVAGKILKATKLSKKHHLDAAYEGLKCELTKMDKKDSDFKLIQDYVTNTHGTTHKSYTLEVLEAFTVVREGEDERFADEISNKTLLFHGSRNSNWMGILGQGLRIAPPEAPVTGYMFGKGVYFADCSSKSANYCKTSHKDNIGFMTLNEVALGNSYDLTAAKYIDKLPKGKQSCKGCGTYEPSTSMTCDSGITWPLGKLKDSEQANTSLLYNEYVVYDVSQIRTKYLLKLKFNYH